ncbi:MULTISPECIES: M20/M25/M40 family metallo-hydrolase [unclassified Leeuwenhoekiella]|uniref:M20/M25/M40 family metallo-hydrolase n=1 Tax=unclassified Leeuwenhoekiella TaxID=2615029 RepID=UPI000C5D16B0|nr:MULTISPECIES: M20/M25/M40 family metallo-hydrolase [unclassified Leeuwenhoekiella]MAW96740.1 peptidase M28 [Leeuwenhoekiella sp.]MBA81629.1 peptidase M28 [Leeuwenhoekiella sp.]|tara:strand:+ start:16089 stop:17639 length:1551 start_codon:yes stop_codon:yes gene_type:complete
MKKQLFAYALSTLFSAGLFAQTQEETVSALVTEATENSQLKVLAHQLLDVIGPRLVGTPEMKEAHDWAVKTYTDWGIPAENQQWGVWKAWDRGITHIDLVSPRSVSLEGMQLAWSPSTSAKGVEAEVVILPEAKDSLAFQNMLNQVKGKFVLISMPQPTGRPDDNWEEWATPESFEKIKTERDALNDAWNARIKATGYSSRELPKILEKAGAVGVITSNWSRGFGVNKVFSAYTDKIPMVDIALEDYGLLYRLAEYGDKPEIKVVAQSKDLGEAPTFNTIAQIKGTEKPDEYVILSAHFDSWDGAQGATDNGTGTLVMMEAMRILKKVYPNPKRTILVGHWGSEEQGLNGSRSFVKDHPEIVAGVQAVFNQDNGTGRVATISGNGFLNAYDYLGSWLNAVPEEVAAIETNFPGTPGRGGSDYASFVAAGAPAFNLSSLSWNYWNYTWHTNRDTYDKIVWDDVQNNVILTAVLAYMASEDEDKTSRDQIVLPVSRRTGEQITWPEPRDGNRRGGLED